VHFLFEAWQLAHEKVCGRFLLKLLGDKALGANRMVAVGFSATMTFGALQSEVVDSHDGCLGEPVGERVAGGAASAGGVWVWLHICDRG
jgi:hypothetical protein